jgi:hypothetical protein
MQPERNDDTRDCLRSPNLFFVRSLATRAALEQSGLVRVKSVPVPFQVSGPRLDRAPGTALGTSPLSGIRV